MENLEGRFGPFDEQHIGWSRPMLPLEYVQASCNKCHNVMEAPIPGADHLNAGWQLVQEKGCKTCHYIVDSGAKQAPELSTVGTKFYNESGHAALSLRTFRLSQRIVALPTGESGSCSSRKM